jgi:hypothetical protein
MVLRQVFIVVLMLTGVLCSSCGSDSDSFFTITVAVPFPKQTVPGFAQPPLTNCDFSTGLLLNSAALAGLTVRLSEEDEFAGHDLLDIRRVRVERVIFEIIDEAPGGDRDTFDFLDSIRLFADDPNDNQAEVLVLELDPVPSGRKRLVIPGTDVNIADIASRDSFMLRAEVSGRPPCDNVNFVGEVEFAVRLF